MSLDFKAVKWVNRNTPLQIKPDSLPVTKDAQGKLAVLPEKVLVKVRAAALNPVDLILKNVAIPGLFRAEKGFGLDYAGDVVAIGSSAAAKTKLAVGDKVCGLNQQLFGNGTLSEYSMVDPFKESGASIRKIPGGLSYEEAAAYPLVFGTAELIFDHCHQGNTYNKVLILGAGTSVGRYCVQLAKQVYGLQHIVVTCSGKTEPLARKLGATEVIDYTKNKSILNPVLESVQATGKFDAILDCCGNNDLFPEITTIIRDRSGAGTYNTLVGDAKVDYSGNMFAVGFKNIGATVRGIRSKLGWLPYYYGAVRVLGHGAWADKVPTYFEHNNIEVFIDSTYPFEDFDKAVARLQSNKATGKVVVTF